MSSIITRGFGQFELIPTRGYGIGEYVKINWEPDIINVKYAYMTKPKSRVVTYAVNKPQTKVVKYTLTKPKSVRSKYQRKNYHIDSY